MMQPKPAPLAMQPTLPFEIPRRMDPSCPEMEEALTGQCTPEKTWETLGPQGQDQLRRTWLHVLKGVVNDAQDR